MIRERERIEELEEEIRQLRDLLFSERQFTFLVRCREVLGASPMEARLLQALTKRRTMTREALMIALYSDRPDDPPHTKIIDVLVCKLRSRLGPLGISISTIWGQGYRIAAEDMIRLIDVLGLAEEMAEAK